MKTSTRDIKAFSVMHSTQDVTINDNNGYCFSQTIVMSQIVEFISLFNT